MGFQRRSERLNGVLLLDALGEDIPEGGSDISEGTLAVPLRVGFVMAQLSHCTKSVPLICRTNVQISGTDFCKDCQ